MCNMGQTGVKNTDNWQERMCRLCERVSEAELVPTRLIYCAHGKQRRREQREDGERDKEQRGETEDSYVLRMRSSGWL